MVIARLHNFQNDRDAIPSVKIKAQRVDEELDQLVAELASAAGSLASLTARLGISINDDGTAKGTANVSQWVNSGLTPTYVSATQFTVVGDYAAIFTVGTRLYLTQTANDYVTVVSSSYSNPNTTVTVEDGSADSGITQIDHGITKAGATGSLPKHSHDNTEGAGGQLLFPDFFDGGEAGGANRSLGNTDAFSLSFLTNNAAFLTADSDGIVDLPRQSSVRAYSSSTVAIASGVNTKIQLDAESYDIQNEFDSATNYRFTTKKAGNYPVIASCNISGLADGKAVTVFLFKNGVFYSTTLKFQGALGSGRIVMSDFLNLVTGDYVESWVQQSSGSSLDNTGSSSSVFLDIHKIN